MTPLSLSQVTALVVVYRRLVIVWGVGPVLVVALPLILQMGLWILNVVSAGYAGLTVAIFLALTMTACEIIRSLTADANSTVFSKALQSNQRHLPAVLVFSCVVARMIGPKLAFFWTAYTSDTAALPFLSVTLHSIRLAIILALLGLTVMARFVGPKSVIRCSTIPLVSNPLSTTLQDFWHNPILTLLQPSDTPGEVWTTAARVDQQQRFQRPTWSITITQAILALFLGVGVSTLATVWTCPKTQAQQWTTLFAFVMTLLVPLWTSTLNGVGHELNPKEHYYYTSSRIQHSLTGRQLWPSLQPALQATTFVVFVSSLCLVYLLQDEGERWDNDTTFWTLRLALACLFSSWFVYGLDQVVRYRLFCPRIDLRSVVNELYYDGTQTPLLTVLVQSIVRSEVLTKEIINITPTSAFQRQDELERCRQLSHPLASRLLLLDGTNNKGLTLEDDVMQIAVLEALPRRPEWLLRPVVQRALCVYVAGLAEALHRLHVLQPPNRHCILPAGLLCAAECAVTALGVTTENDTVSKMMSLSSLECIFALHTATREFATANIRTTSTTADTATVSTEEAVMINPALLPLLRACEAAAALLLKQHSILYLLEPRTMEWAQHMVHPTGVN
jgi:hypothetical protein